MTRQLRDLRSDNRALALSIVAFAAMLVIAAFLFTILFVEALDALHLMTESQADSQQATDQINLAWDIGAAMSVYGLVLAAVFLITRSVLESRGPR